MHYPIDYIVIAILILFIVRGFMRGFLKTIIGPFLVVIGAIASYIYYKRNQNLLIALGLSILIPIGLGIISSLLSKFLKKEKEKKDLFLLSRITGAFLSGLWGAALIILTLIVFVEIPAPFSWLKKGQEIVASSRTYQLINKLSNHALTTPFQSVPRVMEVLQNPKEMKKIEFTKEYQAVIQDDKIQNILGDKEIQNNIKNKNYFALLSNPKMKAVLADKELAEKMLELYKRIAKMKKPTSFPDTKSRKDIVQ